MPQFGVSLQHSGYLEVIALVETCAIGTKQLILISLGRQVMHRYSCAQVGVSEHQTGKGTVVDDLFSHICSMANSYFSVTDRHLYFQPKKKDSV